MQTLASKKVRGNGVHTSQATLFDQFGTPHFHFDTDVRVVAGVPGVFDIAGMTLILEPPPTCESRAVGVVVDCLRELWRTPNVWRSSKIKRVGPVMIDVWLGFSCAVTFRPDRDDGAIRANLVAPLKIELSLPHSTMWRTNGLFWLACFENCCEQNRSNPTPWLGTPCNCPVGDDY